MNIACASFLLAVIASSAQAFRTSSPFRPLPATAAARAKSTSLAVTTSELAGAQSMIDALIEEKNCGPIFVRLAWHDSGTYDQNVASGFPKAGGAIGSIRFAPEINHGANNGLSHAVKLLEPVKEAYPGVSYADIYQMASARTIALAGGPAIDMKYGRVDATSADDAAGAGGPPEGNLPDAEAGPEGKFGGNDAMTDSAVEWHLRKVFYRMGFGDEEIVALSGAHTIGRAYADRSGLGAEKTKFSDGTYAVPLPDGTTTTKYTPGGSPWVENWLVFDNSYFNVINDASTDAELLKLTSDKILFKDAGFKPYAMKYGKSKEDFFQDYAKAHKKLSELGSKFEPVEQGAATPSEAASATA